ncbi:hypothetical protein OPQ81_011748 [Rhizoctonia solani]|nr:hypothetical protein OPQ81_011748 [Rhizoctonia solani]
MGIKNRLTFQAHDNTPHPLAIPAPNDPHPAVVILYKSLLFVQSHVAILGFLFPEILINTNPDGPHLERGVRQAQVMLAPPLVAHVEVVHR